MHHRGTIRTPGGDTVTRGSVWIEQELAICAFVQHVLDRQLAVVLYLQRGISREGIRSQLRLKPVEFDSVSDVLADLRTQVAGWQLETVATAPLIARWEWKRQPGDTDLRHEYKFFVELYNISNALIDQWKIELWFPSEFIEQADRSQSFIHLSKADTNYFVNEKRIFPGGRLAVFTVPYFVTYDNWPGTHEGPKVRIRVSTANAQFWEEEISIMDIQKF